jgi:fucose permease
VKGATTMSIPATISSRTAARPLDPALRNLLIGTLAFLTVVDLFATQAILPKLRDHYGVSPAEIGLAVNAGTLGMALAGMFVALASDRLDRKRGVVLSLWRMRPISARLQRSASRRASAWRRHSH